MNERGLSRRRLLAVTGSTLSAALAGCSMGAPADDQESGSTLSEDELSFPEEAGTPRQTLDRPSGETAATEVYNAVVDSVAAIEIQTQNGRAGGTAWVYDGSYLVTNAHVVRNGSDPYLRFNDRGWREASVVGSDRSSDLAVLDVEDRPDSATPLPLVETERPVGTPVAAVGNPFGLSGSFSTGIISGRNRTIPIPGSDFTIADGIQTDAALNPGNSGGPLVTYDGTVAGVVSAGQGDNVGYAISAAMTRNVVPALIEDGEYEHSHMGVRLLDVRPILIEANNLPVSWGVYIHEVLNGGPSDDILQGSTSTAVVDGREALVGGDVIVAMGRAEWADDDRWAITDRERLSAFLALETEPGDTIAVEVIRDGERQVVELTLGSRPDIDS